MQAASGADEFVEMHPAYTPQFIHPRFTVIFYFSC
jgi:hypothetical protein